MNDEDTSRSDQISTPAQPGGSAPAFSPMPNTIPMPPQQPKKGMKVALAAVLVLVVILLIVGAYYLGTLAPANKQTDTSAVKTDTTSELTELGKKEDATTTPIAGLYDGWQEYTNPSYSYSFKYPMDWQVNRKVIQAPSDWVSVNLPGEENPSSNDIIAFHTYLDGTGCGQIKERQFMIGSETATGKADCGDMRYTVMTKSSDGTRVAVRIDTAQGNDDNVTLVLKSVSGLTVVK